VVGQPYEVVVMISLIQVEPTGILEMSLGVSLPTANHNGALLSI
jgi:hypothetical protein